MIRLTLSMWDAIANIKLTSIMSLWDYLFGGYLFSKSVYIVSFLIHFLYDNLGFHTPPLSPIQCTDIQSQLMLLFKRHN